MRIKLLVIAVAVLAAAVAGYGHTLSASPAPAPRVTTAPREMLSQYSTLSALKAGVFDGQLTIAELGRWGDLGLGTFNRLNGEMIVLGGVVYQVTADGEVHRVRPAQRTPFAVVTSFEPDMTRPAPGGATLAELEAAIDQMRPSDNLPYAVRVRGSFSSMLVRSVPAQQKPYPTLDEALTHQVEFPLEDVRGVLVGFWLPSYMAGANAAGYHFHFLTADRTAGGHVLDCQVDEAVVGLDQTARWYVRLPTSPEFTGAQLP